MTIGLWPRSCLTAMLLLLLAAPLCEAARKKNAVQPLTPDVEATVISLRRYELGTYVEVMRDDGLQEWIEINREQGLELKANQRIVYSTRSPAHQNTAIGMVRYGVDFRILSPQHDEQIYRETSTDGTPVFTDNPSVIPSSDRAGINKQKDKFSREPGIDEVIVVDPEEAKRKEAIIEEYYKYSEQASSAKPVRKAKRAKPKQE